ncbi:hypothetical protein Ddye_025596 [Dipteronia dyeriana]|uniref:F-box associated beta-propeller type 1 domain-containing protein n=1 Tax=Dipteronia dyeriana TaxID=168575 RepID=A0AAD9WNN9_9ROSI|nr:hypothetical protein Ddye_025596 [Dipteronia dyeriana]
MVSTLGIDWDYIELPKSKELPNQNSVFGFGVNQTTNKYKVIQVVYWKHRNRRRRDIFRPLLPVQVLVRGRLHWHTWSIFCSSRITGNIEDEQFSCCPIISFDFEDEQFREVAMPSCGDLDKIRCHLVDLGGCVSAAVFNGYEQIEIWIMKEYDVKESWIKEFNIGNHVPRSLEEEEEEEEEADQKSSFDRVVGLLKTGEVLLEYKCRALVIIKIMEHLNN